MDVDADHIARMQTPAGQCVVAFTMGVACTWSAPGEGLGAIERAAAGDTEAREIAMRLSGGLGASPRAVELVIDALTDAKQDAAEASEEVTARQVMVFLLPRLADEFYPGIDLEGFAKALMQVRNLEFYLISRLHGDDLPRPEALAAQALYDFAATVQPLLENPLDTGALRWASEQCACWLDQKLQAVQAGQGTVQK